MVQVKYFSGYIRNYKKLCTELGIALPLSREDRELQIITKGFEKWGTEIVDHLYGSHSATRRRLPSRSAARLSEHTPG